MGSRGSEPGVSLGLRSFLAVWPSSGKGWAKFAQGPASPCGASVRKGPRRDGDALWSHGAATGWPIPLPGWGWHFLWAQEPLLIPHNCPLSSSHGKLTVSPTSPRLHPSSGFSASAAPEVAFPHCCRASLPQPSP